MLEFRILGPFEVVADDRSVPLGGNKQRALLAVLLLHRGEVVSSDRLIDELWGERAPATATKTLQVYVSNLRKVLGDGLLTTRGRGYEFAPAADQVDCDRFQRLARDGRDALQRGDPRAARVRLHDALELWRGPPLSDFSYEQFAQAEIARLEEARLAALEDRIEADLALGQGAALVPELEALAREHPLRERLHGHLMLALYRSGRQADALERYHQARRMLVDQFGIEPGPSLKDLEHRILNQDPGLGRTRSPPSPTAPRRLVSLLALAGLLIVAAAAAATLELAGGHGHSAALLRSRSDSVAMISPTSGQQRASFPVGNNPSSVAVGAGAAWTANADDDTVTRIDLVSHAERTYGTTGIPLDLAVGDGSLWILNANEEPLVAPKSVSRLDPITSSLATIPLPKAPHGPLPLYDMALGPQGAWVINGDTASRVDPDRNRVVQTIRNLKPLGIASGPEGTWVIEGGPNATVARLIPHSQKVAQRIGIRPRSLSGSIAIGAGAIWAHGPGRRRAMADRPYTHTRRAKHSLRPRRERRRLRRQRAMGRQSGDSHGVTPRSPNEPDHADDPNWEHPRPAGSRRRWRVDRHDS